MREPRRVPSQTLPYLPARGVRCAPESGGFFEGALGRLLSSGILSESFRSASAGMTGVFAIVRMLRTGKNATKEVRACGNLA